MTRHLHYLIAAVLALVQPLGQAGEFSVSPIRVTLSGAARSQLLAITNIGNEPARFLVRSAGWTVNDAGAAELSADDSLSVFPASFTVPAKGTQNIRVGTDQKQGDTEKTWRIVLEQLPDPNAAGNAGTTINVLSVLSVPVFMPPLSSRKAFTVNWQSVKGNSASVLLANDGNAHELVSSVSVTALRGTETAAQAKLEGWYLLPGKKRAFNLVTQNNWCAPDITAFELRALDREGQALAQQTVDAREACK